MLNKTSALCCKCWCASWQGLAKYKMRYCDHGFELCCFANVLHHVTTWVDHYGWRNRASWYWWFVKTWMVRTACCHCRHVSVSWMFFLIQIGANSSCKGGWVGSTEKPNATKEIILETNRLFVVFARMQNWMKLIVKISWSYMSNMWMCVWIRVCACVCVCVCVWICVCVCCNLSAQLLFHLE